MMKKIFYWSLLFAFVFVVFATACITGFAIELLYNSLDLALAGR